MTQSQNPGTLDVVLIGAGIMSATLGAVLKELEPSLTITMFETLEDCGLESSEGWNNAGTGHAANCELNYTPQRADGSVDISEALKVNTEFDLSRQLWSYLIRKGAIRDPRSFIHPVPHMSFVWGQDNVAFLRKALRGNVRKPLLLRDGVQRQSNQDRRMGAADHGRSGERGAVCGNPHHHGHGCRLWRFDSFAGEPSSRSTRRFSALQTSRRGLGP